MCKGVVQVVEVPGTMSRGRGWDVGLQDAYQAYYKVHAKGFIRALQRFWVGFFGGRQGTNLVTLPHVVFEVLGKPNVPPHLRPFEIVELDNS